MPSPENTLDYLLFEHSLDTDGVHTFDAVASTSAGQRRAVLAEAERVLAWASAHFQGEEGPLEDGGTWCHDLQCTEEAGGWHTVTLSLSGRASFGEAFAEAYSAALTSGTGTGLR